jgi:hypothetical protein
LRRACRRRPAGSRSRPRTAPGPLRCWRPPARCGPPRCR